MEEPPTLPARLPYDPPCVLCLGRLVPEKGFDVALRVFAQVRERVPSARFLIAGDGVERPRLEQQARELDLGDRVEFLGWVRPGEVPALINRATLVLMPSRRESFSLVAIETAHMARPTVATRAAGLAEVVVDGETGLLVAKEDVPALSHAVLTLLGHPDLARRMGHAARQRARELFNLPRCVGRFDELYRRLVWGRREAVGLAVHP
jgi:glycogen(starch) synthase